MKTLKTIKFLPLLILTLVVFVSFSCSEDDDPILIDPQELNIVETAQATGDLSSLVAAVVEANLVTTLSGDGPFTVLAPTNAAFATFLNDNGWATVQDIPDAALEQVLLNHVISGEVMSADLVSEGMGYASTNADGTGMNKMSIFYDASSGVKFNNVATVTIADIMASNGVVHIVDQVIGLPTVVDFALADPTFATLVTALTRADLTFDYVSTLSTPDGTAPAPFTVFAPTNDAFTDLLTELNVSGLGDIPEPTLKATLDHHAVAGLNVRSGDLTDNFTVPTLGGNITANVTGGATLTDANNRVSNIIAVDVQASNGVIHVIDKVVLPPLQ